MAAPGMQSMYWWHQGIPLILNRRYDIYNKQKIILLGRDIPASCVCAE